MNKKSIVLIIVAVLAIAAILTVVLLCCNKPDQPVNTNTETPAPQTTQSAGAETTAPETTAPETADGADTTDDPLETGENGAELNQDGEDVVIEIPTDQGSGGL